MVYFHTKNPNLGIFWRALEIRMANVGIFYDRLEYLMAYFMAVWYSLWSFGIFFIFLV
jgi:hypothetical protein